MDMPIPDVATWEWANWKFPKPVRAGDTIYARWTLTQKRAPVGSAKTSIVVWRVDVHTTDGAMCAEGDVGASVFRAAAPPRQQAEAGATPVAAAPATAPSRRRRRRVRTGGAEQPAQAPATPPPAIQADRPAGTRRRRRRRSSSGPGNGNGGPAPAEPGAPPAPSAPPEPETRNEAMVTSPANRDNANPLSRVMKRLRRT